MGFGVIPKLENSLAPKKPHSIALRALLAINQSH
jgi:hypothetical protein